MKNKIDNIFKGVQGVAVYLFSIIFLNLHAILVFTGLGFAVYESYNISATLGNYVVALILIVLGFLVYQPTEKGDK